MKTIFKSFFLVAVLALVLAGCDKSDNSMSDVNLKSTDTEWAISKGGITPWFHVGNVNKCSDVGYDCVISDICTETINFDAGTGKFDADFPEGIMVTMSADGKYVTWSSDRPVTGAVVVKGGSDAHVYEYAVCTSGDTDLVSPKVGQDKNIPTLSHLVFCFQYCDEECFEWKEETAWGGTYPGPIPVNPKTKKPAGAWWFLYDGDGAQSIWAGQSMNAGSVELIGGYIFITLAEGWYLQDVDEPVKIQGYNVLPPARPAAGLFAYRGSDLIVPVGVFDYYAIHLDVRKKVVVDCPIIEE